MIRKTYIVRSTARLSDEAPTSEWCGERSTDSNV